MTPDRTGHRILIVAREPLLAALVGRLVESARYTPAFPGPDEHAETALQRVKPLAALLLDADDPAVESDLLVSRARRMSVAVMLFGSRGAASARATWARAHELRVFILPEELGALELALEALMPDSHRPRSERDRRGTAERRPDGTLVFTDAAGVRWNVYDRRGGQRRDVVDRRFVSEAGEVRHCDISSQESLVTTPAVLADQLDRALAD